MSDNPKMCKKTNDICEVVGDARKSSIIGKFEGRCFCNSFSLYTKTKEEFLDRVFELCDFA